LAVAAAARGQCPDCHCTDHGAPPRFAAPSDTGRYVGYYVGGGSPFRGDPPGAAEGVWGWDYAGACFWPRIALWWNHGRLYQGGPGAYRTDGPRIIEEHKEKKGE
jgi:hypothetical protein